MSLFKEKLRIPYDADKSLALAFSDFLASNEGFDFLDDSRYVLLPGFCDVHVHFREPGFSYKETVLSGSLSAARGGFTSVLTMPNLNPVPDSLKGLEPQLEAIKKDAVINVIPYGAITSERKGEVLSDMKEIAPFVCAFSDDGSGVQNDEIMKKAMLEAKALGKIIAAHCEVNSLLKGGYIHDGKYATENGHRGICSESEYAQIERDLKLIRETGCSYHVCHISAKESVELIRNAKKEGLDVTCETAPHYLIMDDSYLKEDGKFKMNPPLRDKEDRLALIEGIKDGTIEMIATDHAPHSAEEKSKGLSGSAFGIVGLETSFSAMYTHFVKPGIITMEKLIELMSINPRKRFGISDNPGFSVWDLSEEFTVDPASFLSMGRATPFEGMKLSGKCITTVYNSKPVYKS